MVQRSERKNAKRDTGSRQHTGYRAYRPVSTPDNNRIDSSLTRSGERLRGAFLDLFALYEPQLRLDAVLPECFRKGRGERLRAAAYNGARAGVDNHNHLHVEDGSVPAVSCLRLSSQNQPRQQRIAHAAPKHQPARTSVG